MSVERRFNDNIDFQFWCQLSSFLMHLHWYLFEYSLLIALLLFAHALCECEVEIKSGDTLSQISFDVGCGTYKGAKYNVRYVISRGRRCQESEFDLLFLLGFFFHFLQAMLNLNRQLGRFTSDNSIPLGTKVLVPDLCIGSTRPTRCTGEVFDF